MGMRNLFFSWLWNTLLFVALVLVVLAGAGYMLSPREPVTPTAQAPAVTPRAEPNSAVGKATDVASGVRDAAGGAKDAADGALAVGTTLVIIAAVGVAVALLVRVGITLGKPDGPIERHRSDHKELEQLRAQRSKLAEQQRLHDAREARARQESERL
jgi:hypothetical protein